MVFVICVCVMLSMFIFDWKVLKFFCVFENLFDMIFDKCSVYCV